MAFSQSLEIGNSTFMCLESEVHRAITDDANSKELDIIQESPTSHARGMVSLSRTRSRIFNGPLNSANEKSRLRLRRSRSDSTITISKVPLDTAKSQTDNYSEFFRSDFSFSAAEHKEPINAEGGSFVRVSQIDAALSDQNNIAEPEASSSVLDMPICSEDVKDFLQTEETDTLWRDSLPPSAVLEMGSVVDTEEVSPLDASSFLCPAPSSEVARELSNEMHHSLPGDRTADQLSMNALQASTRSMSPEQLEWSAVTACTDSVRVDPQQTETSGESPPVPVVPVPVVPNNLESLKRISAWNLPHSVLAEYEKKGVVKMFDWQIECLSNPKVLFEHRNLVYSAPTSAGKTLVSEILLLKTVLERGKKVLMILPFISVVREKMFYLQDLLTSAGYRVEGFFGGYTPPGGFDSINVAICTIEKANSIVNKLLEQGKLEEIGTVVVDEVHLISDPGRGYILELLLAKVLYMSRKYAMQIQVITMSATLANVELLKRWLDAELFITDFRPVALQEMIKIGDKIYDSNMQFLRNVTQPTNSDNRALGALQNDSDHVAQLCIETVLEGCSVIVFCPSKEWCENLAVQLAGAIHALGKSSPEWGTRLRTFIKRDAIDEVKKQLRDIPTGLDSVLEKTITYACAFHHAGLTMEERDIIEASFKSCSLKVIVATSTLSSGVNLPARRVLIRSPLFGGKQMSSLTYKQMIGRAGRTGKDTLGESILICTEANARIGRQLITADLMPIHSCLELDSSTHLKRALLEVISSGVAASKDDIDKFVNCTLLCAQKQLNTTGAEKSDDGNKYISDALEFLTEYEFIRLQVNEETHEEHYVATRLGMACLASSMPPTDGLILFSELQKSRRCFVLESELHAVYLVTPYSVCYQMNNLDWLLFLDLWEKLTPAMKKVGELVGVKESFLVRAMRGQTKLDYKLMQVHKRFYTALALQELVNEAPINQVAVKYKCTRGMLQSLQQMASTFAGIVTAFCNSLQWSTLSLIVSQFKERLFFGIHRDLIDLIRLPDLTHKRARSLFDAGITTLVELANADILAVEKILYNSLSFETAKQCDHENVYEAAKRNTERNFFITGKAGLTVAEAARLLILEARQFVQYDIGVGNIKWTQGANASANSPDLLNISSDKSTFQTENKKRQSSENSAAEGASGSPPKLRKMSDNTKIDVVIEVLDDKPSTSREAQRLLKVFVDQKSTNKVREHQQREKLGHDKTEVVEEVKETKKSTDVVSSDNTNSRTIYAKLNDAKDGTKDVKHNIVENSKNEMAQKTNLKTPKAMQNLKNYKLVKAVETTKESPTVNGNLNGSKELQAGKDIKRPRPDQLNTVESKISAILTTRHPHSPPKANAVIPKTKNIQMNTNISTKDKENISKNPEVIPLKAASTNGLKNQHQSNAGKAVNPLAPFKDKLVNNLETQSTTNATSKVQSPLQQHGVTTSGQQVKNRRSPRNFLIRSIRADTLKAPHTTDVAQSHPNAGEYIKDIFMEDDSFELNTGITEMLAVVDRARSEVVESSPAKTNLTPHNESTEEIPSSQNLLSPSNSPMLARSRTPQTSRLLRSYRSQRTASPKAIIKADNAVPLSTESDNHVTTSTIEISNLSIENSLIKNPLHLNAPHILSCSKVDTDASHFECIEIVDICGNQQLFKGAFKELVAVKRFGFCLGLQQQTSKQKPLIGGNLLINQLAASVVADSVAESILFQIDDCNYLAGIAFGIGGNVVYFMNMQQEPTCKGLTPQIKCKYLRMILRSADNTLLVFDAKEQLKTLRKAIPDLGEICCNLEDPKIANWLLQPDKALSFHHLTEHFAPECTQLVNLCGNGRGYDSFGLDSNNAILAKVRCSIEACVNAHILKGQIENLEGIGTGQLYKFFKELEMPLQLALCNMEIYGFPSSDAALRKLFQQMMETMKKLETKIYESHGSRFNLNSSSAVAKVVGLHRKANGRISTSRQILEKIDSPISQLIIVYRKLNVTLLNNIQPLLKCIRNNRIHGQSITFTSTGRISMTEPNLQNVAKDFDVELGAERFTISCRSAFFPLDTKRCLISSDFCQLEMRILAHLSQDASLLQVMNSKKDIFVAIAARWNKIAEDNVTEQLRNGTKQICYGIVYGMGMRSLADSLKCTEQEAALVSEQFHAAYPGIRAYANKVIKFARENCYVETITGRRRYLEHINSGDPQLKKQAERQAINSTIQGSAADIAKNAILRLEKNIIKYREKLGIADNAVHLVMHLHDELIFEVPEEKSKKIAKVLSVTMENCVKLNVPLKVKLKIGRSWGDLKEIKL